MRAQRGALDILVIAGLAGALLFGGGVLWGSHRAGESYAKKESARNTELVVALSTANNKVREREQLHEQNVAKLRDDFRAILEQQFARDSARIAELSSGSKRLRVQVIPGSCKPGAVPGVPTPEGANDTATAELAPATGTALYRIAADGDQAINQLTALQKYTQELWNACVAFADQLKDKK